MYKYFSRVQELTKEMIAIYEIKADDFYKGRVNKFFKDYMGTLVKKEKPLNAITYFDIDTYLKSLKSSEAERLNHYNALKRFFEYTYLKGESKEVISQVVKPIYERKLKVVLNDEEYQKIKILLFVEKTIYRNVCL